MAQDKIVPAVTDVTRMPELLDRIMIGRDAIREAQRDINDAQQKLVVELARRGFFHALKPDLREVHRLVERDSRLLVERDSRRA